MILYPAIDIMGGCAVRLRRGDFAAKTLYDADPLEAARRWVADGARNLHVVDLDGAREGASRNLGHVRRIVEELGVDVQVGGGLRSREAIEAAIEAGAARVILGTAALGDPELLAGALADHGAERVMVSVDARGGRVVTDGWERASDVGVGPLIGGLVGRGVQLLLYTNVDRDGMLEGVGEEDVQEAARAAGEASLIYSGGIGSLGDLRGLAALGAPSLDGVIVGKALYEGRFTVAQALQALQAVQTRS
ncbi:MAG: 1-(5-phosphoribosyl)-5-[(5-phosphoribosylamino)methylideneamino]imidazole-4-carboxamide isomerase [Acidobacteriota bacterium]|nr:1-(5-phosphoribosyl)-5-[(5-phosphoribosylamino)methylideneamino]imidazole-4-carboxamide isomerase [Acidobacteriota bacterium]